MKILVVQESDWVQRNPHQQHHLMERLSVRGHEIRVIDYPSDWNNGKLLKKREVVDGYHKIHSEAKVQVISPTILQVPIFVYPCLVFSHRKEIKRQIKEFKPDVIVGFGIINTYLASRTAKKEGIPFIYYWIDVLHRLIPEKAFHPLGEYIERATIQNSTEVIAINKKLEEFVKGLGATNTSVIGAGIDLDKFDPTLEGDSVREKYNIKEEDTVLFFMGFLYHFAGLKELALEFARKECKNLKLLIVGDGDAYDDLQKIVGEHDLGNNVIMTGRKPYSEIPELVAASDICILPADPDEEIMHDIVPIKIYEYMAMGKPVITTKLPGVMKEFGLENGISYVEKPSDVLVKASSIDFGAEGVKARRFAEDNDWYSITNEFEGNLIQSLGDRNEE